MYHFVWVTKYPLQGADGWSRGARAGAGEVDLRGL